MKLLDGKFLARERRKELAAYVSTLPYIPCLTIIMLGDDSASRVYIQAKKNACEETGIRSENLVFPYDTSEQDLLQHINKLNNDERVDGILVQLPLPLHIHVDKIFSALNPLKDVDCLHPINLGMLLRSSCSLMPCTPKGILSLLDYYGIELDGKEVVIINRSIIVGKTLAVLAGMKKKGRNATVVLCHSGTKDVSAHTRRADILISAVGIPGYINGRMIKRGVAIIDVSVNRLKEGGKQSLVGDINVSSVQKKAAYLSPVPGGVGPMTIAMLLENTVELSKKRRKY